MTNYFDKMKEDIITGAESGYFGGDETPELTDSEIAEHFDESNANFKELAVMIAAEPLESLKDADEIITADKIIAAGGEAAVEAIKQKGYAVKKMGNRGYDKIIKVVKGLLGWFTGSSADFKKLSTTAKALNKRLDKVVLPAEKEDNKVTIKAYNVDTLIALVVKATGTSGRVTTTVQSGAPITAIKNIAEMLKRIDKETDLMEITIDNPNKTLASIKSFNEGNYLDEVRDYLDSLKADDDKEVAPNAALTEVKGMLSKIATGLNFNNKSQKDLSKLISNIEKNMKPKEQIIAGAKISDEKKASIEATTNQVITAFASAVITYRKSALQACTLAKKELNNIITLGYRIESMGKKTK